jgi:alpha-D-glucose phosphate-specific phosphoglucomutase
MSSEITFGTDGWRALIAEDFTFDNVRACAQGVADYLHKTGIAQDGLIIGYDTRFASEDFAAASAEIIAANGINVFLCEKAAPTPVISYLVTEKKLAGAIIITASHNPGQWNGFKFKDHTGASAPGELVLQIEKNAHEALKSGNIKRIPLTEGLEKGTIAYLDPLPIYTAQVKRLLDLEPLRQSGFHIIVDSMYGAGIGYFNTMLQGGNVEIEEINGERNPLFPGIQPEPIAKNLTRLSTLMPERKAHVGLATDGDADRIGIMDEKGDFLNPHQVFALLSLYFLEVHGERRPIIKSLCATDMLYRLGELYNIPVFETPVGFKYVAPLMLEKDAFIGGEESGGYGFRGHVPERDGILAGLFFLDFMVKTGKTPSQLLAFLYSKVGEHYYDRYDIHITPEQKKAALDKVKQGNIDRVAGIKVARLITTDGFKYLLDDSSWLLLRFSGTEPLLRIYAESHSHEKVKKLLDYGKTIVGM